jgi:threonine aldolase
LDYLLKNGVKASAFGPQTIRLVTHLDVSAGMIEQAIAVMAGMG